MRRLETGAYVAELAREGLSGELLPAVTFLLAAVISFATGSSWGTIIIMMPLAIPAAVVRGRPLGLAAGSNGLRITHSASLGSLL